MMHFFIKLVLTASMAAALSFSAELSAQSNADNNQSVEPNDRDGDFKYISDDLFTYLRAGPGDNYRFIGSVTAGTRVQVLQVNNQAGYTEIIDERQRTGWVESKFVNQQPSLKYQLQTLQNALDTRNNQTRDIRTQLADLQESVSEANSQNLLLNKQVSDQFEEITRLNNAIEQRDKNSTTLWFTRGAVLALASLVIGYILGMIGRRRKRHSGIM